MNRSSCALETVLFSFSFSCFFRGYTICSLCSVNLLQRCSSELLKDGYLRWKKTTLDSLCAVYFVKAKIMLKFVAQVFHRSPESSKELRINAVSQQIDWHQASRGHNEIPAQDCYTIMRNDFCTSTWTKDHNEQPQKRNQGLGCK